MTGLALRNCPVCGACFQPTMPTAIYCNRKCRVANEEARRKARAAVERAARPPQVHACDVCGKTFTNRRSLGGHKVLAHRPRTRPAPEVVRCHCGHAAATTADLNRHRRSYHQADPMPVTVKVLASLTFTCPVEGCGRTYDDSNRLAHHKRVIHDPPAHVPQEVVVHGPITARRVA